MAVRNPTFNDVAARIVRSQFDVSISGTTRDFQGFAKNRPVLVFSSAKGFGASFQKRLKGRSVRLYPLEPERPDLVDKVMRANPGAVGVIYASGKHHASLTGKIGSDTAKRTLMIALETPGLTAKAKDFKHFVELHYRHPQLGGLVADHFFGQESLELRRPASRPPTKTSAHSTVDLTPASAE
jgi:hypothetical protein